LSSDSDSKVILSIDEWMPRGSNIDYYRQQKKPSGLGALLEQPDLKAAALLEQQQLTKSNLQSEEEFLKAHGGREKVYDAFKDPYSEDEKKILLENYCREPATRRALDILTEFTLGERTELVMDTSRAYADQNRQNEAIKMLSEDPMLVDYLDDLATIDEKVNATDRFTELLISGENFGRSVLVMQYDPDGIPVRLIPLASIRLGKVYADIETWEILGIEYKDYKGEQRILKAEDIIHYEANDYHIVPNSRYFGRSTAEPTMYTAMSLRTTNEIALPEIRKQKWAPFHILQLPQIESQEKLDQIRDALQPGKTQVWGAGDIKIHELKLNDINLDQFHNSIVSSEKDIFRSFGIALVFAFQDEQNRSTAQFSSNLMRVTKLTKIRTRLKNVLEPQWYERNLRALMKKRDKEVNELQGDGLEQYQDTGVVNALERSTKILKIDPNALPFRPRMKFVDKKVDTFLEISEAALGWYQANILSKEEAAELGQLDQYVEKIAAREAEQKLLTPTTPAPITEPAVPQKITDLTPNFGGAQGGSVIEGLEELKASHELKKIEITKQIAQAVKDLNSIV
jgi:hypothetical protein